jgi:hypothetical protein
MLEVYVDNFMNLIIPVSQEQIRHDAMAVMTGIHDVFLPDDIDNNNPISEKKIKRERALIQPEKHSWDSISMGKKKLCGSKRQNTKN